MSEGVRCVPSRSFCWLLREWGQGLRCHTLKNCGCEVALHCAALLRACEPAKGSAWRATLVASGRPLPINTFPGPSHSKRETQQRHLKFFWRSLDLPILATRPRALPFLAFPAMPACPPSLPRGMWECAHSLTPLLGNAASPWALPCPALLFRPLAAHLPAFVRSLSAQQPAHPSALCPLAPLPSVWDRLPAVIRLSANNNL